MSQWAKLLGLNVIGTVSTEAKAEVARAHGCDHVILYGREDVAKRVRELTDGVGVTVVYDSVGKDTFAGSLDSLKRRGLLVCVGTASGPIPPIDAMQLAIKGSVFVTRPALADYIADPAEKGALAGELFGHVAAGRIKIEINQRYALQDAAQAHRDLEVAQDDRLVDLRDLTERQHMKDDHDTPPPPAHIATRGSIKVEPLTCAIGAELSNVNLGDAVARRRARSPRSARCCSSTRCCSSATRTSRAPSTSRSRATSASSRTIRSPAAIPDNPGLVRIYKSPDQPERPLRERLAHRRHVAREAAVRLRAALRRVPAGRRRHDVGQHGRGVRPPARARQDADRRTCARATASRRRFGAAMPIEKRLALHAQFPDAEHPVVRTHPGDRREGPVRQRVHDALHELPHAGERALRPGLRARARASC